MERKGTRRSGNQSTTSSMRAMRKDKRIIRFDAFRQHKLGKEAVSYTTVSIILKPQIYLSGLTTASKQRFKRYYATFLRALFFSPRELYTLCAEYY
jgi:hypothetical protein